MKGFIFNSFFLLLILSSSLMSLYFLIFEETNLALLQFVANVAFLPYLSLISMGICLAFCTAMTPIHAIKGATLIFLFNVFLIFKFQGPSGLVNQTGLDLLISITLVTVGTYFIVDIIKNSYVKALLGLGILSLTAGSLMAVSKFHEKYRQQLEFVNDSSSNLVANITLITMVILISFQMGSSYQRQVQTA